MNVTESCQNVCYKFASSSGSAVAYSRQTHTIHTSDCLLYPSPSFGPIQASDSKLLLLHMGPSLGVPLLA
jgi:hypothetical protein